MTIRIRCFFPMLLLAFAAAQAHSQGAPVAITKEGYTYVSGGVGLDEMQQLQAREKEFNLKLVFTLVEGNYVSDVSVVLKNPAGKSLIAMDAQGPIVLAKLPPGAYVVDAAYGGRTQTRKIKVGDRLRTEYLRWPSNPETDFPVREY